MKHVRIKYISAFIVLFLMAMFRVLLLWVAYYTFQKYGQAADQKMAISKVLNFSSIFPPVMLLIEAVCYLVFRKRFFFRRFVRLHIWMSIVSSFLFPIAQTIFFVFVLPVNRSAEEIAQISREYNYISFYAGWILFALARFVFVVTFVKSVPSIERPQPVIESKDLLDDFSDQ